jgi:hypothetical protein
MKSPCAYEQPNPTHCEESVTLSAGRAGRIYIRHCEADTDELRMETSNHTTLMRRSDLGVVDGNGHIFRR